MSIIGVLKKETGSTCVGAVSPSGFEVCCHGARYTAVVARGLEGDGAVAHARGRAHCRQHRREYAHDELNNRLPSFLLHDLRFEV